MKEEDVEVNSLAGTELMDNRGFLESWIFYMHIKILHSLLHTYRTTIFLNTEVQLLLVSICYHSGLPSPVPNHTPYPFNHRRSFIAS